MAKALVAKTDKLSSSPGAHTWKERFWLSSLCVPLSVCQSTHIPYTHAQKYRSLILKVYKYLV